MLNDEIVRQARVTPDELERVEIREQAELARRIRRYRAGHPRIGLAGRTVLIIDDGIATGSTAKAACQVARAEGAAKVILAVPVAPTDWSRRLMGEADELIALSTPESFAGVGQFYRDFAPTTDEQVVACLGHPTVPPPGRPSGDAPG